MIFKLAELLDDFQLNSALEYFNLAEHYTGNILT